MINVSCSDCHQAIKLQSQPAEGERIICSQCGVELEVINLEGVL